MPGTPTGPAPAPRTQDRPPDSCTTPSAYRLARAPASPAHEPLHTSSTPPSCRLAPARGFAPRRNRYTLAPTSGQSQPDRPLSPAPASLRRNDMRRPRVLRTTSSCALWPTVVPCFRGTVLYMLMSKLCAVQGVLVLRLVYFYGCGCHYYCDDEQVPVVLVPA